MVARIQTAPEAQAEGSRWQAKRRHRIPATPNVRPGGAAEKPVRARSPEEPWATSAAGRAGLARISHRVSAVEGESSLSASLHSIFAPQHSVDYAFVAKPPCVSHPGRSPLPRDETL